MTEQIAFQVEDYAKVIPEMREIYPLHWKEIGLDHDLIPLDPDYELYDQLAKAGITHLVTARDDGMLIGYHISFIRPALHYKSTLMCFSDIFYLLPDYRHGMTGYNFLKFFRDSAKAKGAKRIYVATKLALDVGALMKRLGFIQIERIFSLTGD